MRHGLLSIAVLGVGTAAALVCVPPGGWSAVGAPSTQAIYAYGATLAVVGALRTTGRARAEQAVFAVFLAAMPVVYLRSPGGATWVEAGGLALFGATAIVGFLRAPWLLAGGIAAHGLWDLAHLHRGPVPDWYAIACALIDVSLGIYVASRLPAWER